MDWPVLHASQLGARALLLPQRKFEKDDMKKVKIVTKKKTGKECDVCHRIKYSVSSRIDPFSKEVNNNIIERNFCDSCFQKRLLDI